MECLINITEDIAEVELIGRLDSSWAPYLSDQLDDVVRTGVRDVRLDMSGISFLSSNGIALLIRYHRQMREIGGSFRIVADSEAVSHVLKLTGAAQVLHDERPTRVAAATGAAASSVTLDREGITLQVFKPPAATTIVDLELIGDPAKLSARGYGAADDRSWRAVPDGVALGLGALGPDFAACRDRYGEFLAVAGVAVFRPSEGPNRPDFEHAAGSFIPEVRVLYGMAFRTNAPARLARFEARGEPLNRSVALSVLAEACLDQCETRTAGMILIGETDGLVGAALCRSPVDIANGTHPFAHTQARDWLSMTAEPEYARSTAVVVGVATRAPSPVLAPFVRPISRAGANAVLGHFHAAVVPFRPLPRGSFELTRTVHQLFEPGRVETVLHLLGDSRPIVGAGESTFTRGAFWFVPLHDEG